jgi:hypothetical protein
MGGELLSIQETNLRAIAEAIRKKEGTTEPIAANDFPARIRAIQSGGDGVEVLEQDDLYDFSSGLTLLDYLELILSDSHEVLEGWT